jgi:hypothetical protein
MKIYISGKITGIEAEAPALFQMAEDIIRNMGHEPVNPMKLPHKRAKKWSDFMRTDIRHLMGCQAIWLLPNWQKSRGARIECLIATKLGFVIFHQMDFGVQLDSNRMRITIDRSLNQIEQ